MTSAAVRALRASNLAVLPIERKTQFHYNCVHTLEPFTCHTIKTIPTVSASPPLHPPNISLAPMATHGLAPPVMDPVDVKEQQTATEFGSRPPGTAPPPAGSGPETTAAGKGITGHEGATVAGGTHGAAPSADSAADNTANIAKLNKIIQVSCALVSGDVDFVVVLDHM